MIDMKWLAALACIALAGCTVNTAAPSPYPAPPPTQVEIIPKPPVSAVPLVWQPGHYEWNGAGYVWYPGEYVQRAGHGTLWQPGYWSRTGAVWAWQRGHWE
jgi:hypothetical protein